MQLETLSDTRTRRGRAGIRNQSALFSQIGHKGDLLLLHFRDSLEDVHQAELAVARLEFSDYLEPAHSYLSVVELGSV